MKKDPAILFGIIETDTGVFHEGYVEKGVMKYREPTFFQRLFTKPPRETAYLATIPLILERSSLFFGTTTNNILVAVYRTFNPCTNETVEIFAENYGHRSTFDIGAYDKEKKFVLK